MPNETGRLLQNIYSVTDDQGNIRQKSAEQKQYLILENYYDEFSNTEERTWSVLTGRNQVLEYLMDTLNANSEELSLDESLIIVEGVDITDAIKLVDFLEYCIDRNYVTDKDQQDIFEYYIRRCRDKKSEQSEEDAYEAPSSEALNNNLLSDNQEYQEV